MAGVSCALLVVVAGCAACALALPASLLADVKQAEMSHAHSRVTNKVKRAQEVIMFGNQQNHGGDGRNGLFALPRTEKRGMGMDMDDNLLAESATPRPPVEAEDLEEPKALAQTYRQSIGDPDYAQRLQAAYYTDPAALSDLRYYDLDERRKRETFRTPAKRSSRGLATTGRAKRDLDLDPEELLALLNYWQNKSPSAFKHQYNRNVYNPYNAMDSDDNMEMLDTEDGNDISDDDDARSDGWMDGPVSLPAHHFSVGAEPWGRQRFSEDRRKRFMVAKRRPQEGDMYSLGQLLNTPQRDSPTPVFRRFAL